MASRKEEKERLRREREEAERAAQASAARRRRLGLVLGGVLALAVAAIVVFAVTRGGDDDGPVDTGDGKSAALPPKQTDDLQEAVKAAGCKFQTLPDEGNRHLDSVNDTFDEYKTNPPTSGKHRPMPGAAPDGVYPPGGSPDKENWVHTLEHGRVIFMYKPGTPERRVSQLETLMNEEVKGAGAYKTLLMENNTDMPYAVAAVSWRRWVVCDRFTDGVFDAFRAFRKENVDSDLAPEPDFPWPYTGT
ncbi:MAG TPA: DUF3105 domain-containing protein [Solirubrobacteraceae bacterium]|jgi:hypothetical protein|nr:DUF3105 domain-containing protein [Solirubrobacteraceae bacterium]